MGSIRTSTSRTTTTRMAGIVAGAAALVLTACSAEAITERALEEAVERGSDGQVDIDRDSGQITVQDEDGSSASFGVGTDVPAEFADAVSLLDGFEVANVTQIEEDGQVGISVAGAVEGSSMDDALGELDDRLAGGGWAVADEMGEATMYDGVDEIDVRFVERGTDSLMVTVMSDDVGAGPHTLTYLLFPGANA